MLRKMPLIILLPLMAAGMGLYVYPTRPALVWGLLLLCWCCYRLSRHAQARFGAPREDKGQ